MATETEQAPLKGKWDKQDDGTWAVSVRVGGRGAECVGRACAVMAKDKSWTQMTLGDLVRDYGTGDVAIFQVIG